MRRMAIEKPSGLADGTGHPLSHLWERVARLAGCKTAGRGQASAKCAYLNRNRSSAFASPHPSFPRRQESSKDIRFSHEGDDVPPFHVVVKILDSRLRGNDEGWVSAFFSPCRKWFIVALLAVTLCGCAICPMGPCGPPPSSFYERRGNSIKYDLQYGPGWELGKKAHGYLKTACEQEGRIFIKPDIALDEGILILRSNRENALLPLLETAPKVVVPSEIIKYRWHFHNEFRFQSVRMFRELQYGYAIPWDSYDMPEKEWLNLSSFVTGGHKFFIESSAADAQGKIIRRAGRAFWEQAGMREQALAGSLEMKALRDKGVSEADILRDYEATPMWKPFSLPVDTARARYALLVEDVSTLEDRAHWVARGSFRLIERATGETVAEYLSFMAYTDPWRQEKSLSRNWISGSYSTALCPGSKRLDYSVESYAWEPALSFLQTVENARGKAVSDFDALVLPLISEFQFTRKGGSLWIENTKLGVKNTNYVSRVLTVSAEKPLSSMVWRNVTLPSTYVEVKGNATVAGDVLMDEIRWWYLDLRNIPITGNLTVRDSEFYGGGSPGGLIIDPTSLTSIVFERFRGMTTIWKKDKYKEDRAQTPHNKRAIFRFCSGTIDVDGIKAEHVRVENFTGSFNPAGSLIGTLEIVNSNLDWFDLGWAEIDRLEITDSRIEKIYVRSARIAQLKMSGSQIEKDVGDSYKATIDAIDTGGDEALLQKIRKMLGEK